MRSRKKIVFSALITILGITPASAGCAYYNEASHPPVVVNHCRLAIIVSWMDSQGKESLVVGPGQSQGYYGRGARPLGECFEKDWDNGSCKLP